MNKNLKQQLGMILTGNNREAAWAMGRRYLSEETLCWAMDANYPGANIPDHEYDVGRFIEAWQNNTDYEIVASGDFECKADIAVGRSSGMDEVKVILYGAATEDCDPFLYAGLLRNIADWIEANGDAIRNRESASPDLLSNVELTSSDIAHMAAGIFSRKPCRAPEFVHGETYVFPDDSSTAYGPYLAQRHGEEWQLLWIKPDMPIDGKVAMYTEAGKLYHASGQQVEWFEFLTMDEWQKPAGGELPY